MEIKDETMDTTNLPILSLRGVTVFPNMFLHFDAKRDASVKALDIAMKEKQMLFLATQIDASKENVNLSEVYSVGVIAMIKQIVKLPQGITRVLVEGLSRGEMTAFEKCDDYYYRGNIVTLDDEVIELVPARKKALVNLAREAITNYRQLNTKMSKETYDNLMRLQELSMLADTMATHLVKPLANKMQILKLTHIERRLLTVIQMVNNENEVAGIQQDLQDKVKATIDKNQREYYLREQLKVIQGELGDRVDIGEEIDEFTDRLNTLECDEGVYKKIEKEIHRLRRMNANSAESAVLRNYIEYMLELPWDKVTHASFDLKEAKKILENDHYGLPKVKERVLEHLAVRQMVEHSTAPIICLSGPPGTGKTSIARSIAEALGREYVRISLGGVRDEAEIRGHRRTYIGSMPGRLAAALKQAGTANPLILLDEIDKMSQDFKGDPSSALLEVLDSEQNRNFRDHYLEVPLDLSKVLFIATANDLRTIPRPLLDRLEVIDVSSYTENEKFHIAKEYLLPKQLKRHGLKKNQVKLKDDALRVLIHGYTKESGVRQLERRLGELCRKATKSFLLEGKKSMTISTKNLETLIGNAPYRYSVMNEEAEIGVVRGLAWTAMGGDTLSIEAIVMPGKGKFQITGRIGDVMKESASAAMSYLRAKSKEWNLNDEFYTNNDVHIHIPEGAVPKDGPSAGITLATAMISAFTKRAVRHDIAMTGEITLRGRVLAIGGLKEKILAAKRAGIYEIIVPLENEQTVLELDAEITDDVTIHYADHIDDVLQWALLD